MSTSRLRSIDALRGAAALAVALFHATFKAESVGPAGMPRWLGEWVARALSFGWLGVILFFLISGFCIHLRWAKAFASGEGETPRIDFVDFWKRRARRLYPPYLIALAIYLVPQVASGTFTVSAFGVYDLVMHLTMLHNFDPRTVFSIEPVFWTLALEEQLYLAYFVLLGLRVRFGWARTLGVCLLARVGWFGLVFAVRKGSGFELPYVNGCLAQWFNWALGAVCVEAMLGLVQLPRWCARGWVLVPCFLAAAACNGATGAHLGGFAVWSAAWLASDVLWGLGFFVLVNRLIVAERTWATRGRTPRAVPVFAALGLFSYSIYLMHDFVLDTIDPALMHWLGMAVSPTNKLLLMPACLGLTWAFFLLCERPFLNPPSRPAADQPPARSAATRATIARTSPSQV